MKTILVHELTLLGGVLLFAAGCNRTADQATVKSPNSAAPTPAVSVARLTFSDLPVSPKPTVTPQFIEHGKILYAQNCAACHGVNGDGKGDAAAFLLPKPRNFVEAKYRLRSTPTGELPTDVDLFRSLSLGMAGTPMPPWRHMLNDEDRWAVVEYIKSFSPRFESAKDTRPVLVDLGPPPARNDLAISEGKALFSKLACVSCHGESGRGDGPAAATLVDDSNTRIKPRDFTRAAAFKSGYATKEIARTILTGFNGTPMVGFHGTIPPAEAWKIAYYVETFVRPDPAPLVERSSSNFLVREELGTPDVRIKLTERAWKYDPDVIRVKKGQIVEITFEPTDNGLGVGHGLGISSYDEVAFINGVMVGAPKSVKFRADHSGKFPFYCSTQCSTDKLHPLMHGTLIVQDTETASVK